MSLIEKLYSFIIFVSVIVGISIGQNETDRGSAEFFIVPLLVIMLYITFIQLPIEDVKMSFKNLRFTYWTIIMNFVWIPILAWILAILFLSENPVLWIGFIMLMYRLVSNFHRNRERKYRIISSYITFNYLFANRIATKLSFRFLVNNRCYSPPRPYRKYPNCISNKVSLLKRNHQFKEKLNSKIGTLRKDKYLRTI